MNEDFLVSLVSAHTAQMLNALASKAQKRQIQNVQYTYDDEYVMVIATATCENGHAVKLCAIDGYYNKTYSEMPSTLIKIIEGKINGHLAREYANAVVG